MSDINERIIPLDELDDFEVAEGDPDVRGWHVFSSDGQRVGEVDELLVDTTDLKVRYLDVDLDNAVSVEGEEDRHILIPIGYARLDEIDDHILVDTLDIATLSALPPYAQEPLTRAYELSVLQRFDPKAVKPTEADPYATDVYDESRFYGSRRKRTTG